MGTTKTPQAKNASCHSSYSDNTSLEAKNATKSGWQKSGPRSTATAAMVPTQLRSPTGSKSAPSCTRLLLLSLLAASTLFPQPTVSQHVSTLCAPCVPQKTWLHHVVWRHIHMKVAHSHRSCCMETLNPLSDPVSPVSDWQRAHSDARAMLLVCSDSTLESSASGSEGGSGSGQLRRT